MGTLHDVDDDADKEYISKITFKCSDCGLIFRKEHQYIFPGCASRRVIKPSNDDFEKYYCSIGES